MKKQRRENKEYRRRIAKDRNTLQYILDIEYDASHSGSGDYPDLVLRGIDQHQRGRNVTLSYTAWYKLFCHWEATIKQEIAVQEDEQQRKEAEERSREESLTNKGRITLEKRKQLEYEDENFF